MADKEEEDRISSLPDDVLSHILSFLELREAVKTLILSKRWEKVWTSIHRIYLNNNSLEEAKKQTSSFNNFANWVLIGNKKISSVKSFCLWYQFGPSLDREILYVMEWINAAISPNLENFDLRFGPFCFCPTICSKMPRALFQCRKLVTLKLDSLSYTMMNLDVSETVCLPSLVKLHLDDVVLQGENSLKNLLLGCPVLEELHMTDIGNGRGEQNALFVLSPSLKVLRVKHETRCYRFGNRYVVEAPKLEHLEFVEWSLSGVTMNASSPSLVSAVIKICTCKRDPNPLPVIGFFQGICGVRNLELWTEKTIMLKDELANLPELHNLIRLKIGRCKNNNGDIVSCILQHSPRLKHLILPVEFFISKKGFLWSQPERVPECLALHLETIEIGLIYRYEEEVLKMIEYLLDNGKALKKMDLTSIRNKKVLDGLPESDARLYFAKE